MFAHVVTSGSMCLFLLVLILLGVIVVILKEMYKNIMTEVDIFYPKETEPSDAELKYEQLLKAAIDEAVDHLNLYSWYWPIKGENIICTGTGAYYKIRYLVNTKDEVKVESFIDLYDMKEYVINRKEVDFGTLEAYYKNVLDNNIALLHEINERIEQDGKTVFYPEAINNNNKLDKRDLKALISVLEEMSYKILCADYELCTITMTIDAEMF